MSAAPEPRCLACDSTAARPAFEKDGFQHLECETCDSIYVYPAPGHIELAAMYDNLGEQESSVVWDSSRRHLHAAWTRALADVATMAGVGPVLDVGCGTGQFVGFAREQGWRGTVGLEVSESAARLGRSALGDDAIITGALGSAALEPGTFAGVTLWDVIEHLPDPRAAVGQLRRLLKPGGVLVMSTPHRHGLTMRVFGSRSYVVMPPEHLAYFSVAGVRRLVEAEGFAMVRVVSEDIFLREWTKLTPTRRRDETAADEVRSYGETYARLTSSAAALGAFRVINRGLGATKFGDQLYVTCQRVR